MPQSPGLAVETKTSSISTPPSEVLDLIDRFARNKESYQSTKYNEAQLRREFIDPFFRALGWDVENKEGNAEQYKEVIHEDSINVSGSSRAPDYCFRIGGVRKFFVETKKPSTNIKEDSAASFQLRRYAWSAKLPLSILTNFEEFVVYDCRYKPSINDKAAVARIMCINFSEYATRLSEIESVFSRKSVLRGSFDTYAESSKTKKGSVEVDVAFLREIEDWREVLTKNLALRNPTLTQRELNFAVQRLIDRIVFMRICEDRGTEPYGRLKTLTNDSKVYGRLFELFEQADEKYNSGLFHFKKEKDRTEESDDLARGLNIDDELLRSIIKSLYYPESPYEFSVLPADILGQVYEQFLGKVIRLTPSHRAVVEDKPEVKKSGGVFYTPTYIVNFIIKATVGEYLKEKEPVKVSNLRIIDPACGSGSFLIAAYQYLLDWHRDWYLKDGPKKHKNRLYQGGGGGWQLATSERKRILLNNIFGVDIDPQAVEVTKLSLLLKVLESETAQTLGNQLRLFHERALPDLGNNIKCGNSLIDSAFYKNRQTTLVDETESSRINLFDWKQEYPEVFQRKNPGFDIAIGNPPYIRIQNMKIWWPTEVEYYKSQYGSAKTGNYDIYVVFIERGLSIINMNGKLGFIVPHKFLTAKYGQPLRDLLLSGHHLSKVVHFGDQQVFAGATIYTCLLFLEKTGRPAFDFSKVERLMDWRTSGAATNGTIPADKIGRGEEWNLVVGKDAQLFERMRDMPVRLGSISEIFVGLQTSADTVFLFEGAHASNHRTTKVHSKELDITVELESDLLKPVIRSGKIGRYWAEPSASVLFPYVREQGRFKLIDEREMEKAYPLAYSYLVANKDLLSKREHGKFRKTGWYQLYPKNLDLWERPKIMVPYMSTRLSAFYDHESKHYFVNVTTGGFGIVVDETRLSMQYLTALLNSKLMDWYMKKLGATFRNGYFGTNKQYLDQLPIRTIDFANASEKERHDSITESAHQIEGLNKQLAITKIEYDRARIQRQIDGLDLRIDQIVYDLYGLTEEQVSLIEQNKH